MKLRCMIVDDEPSAVSLLEMYVSTTTEWELVAKCYNGLEALSFLREHAVDLILLDINMPQLNGLDLAALIPTSTKIIFTTAYSEHGVESYNFNTIDYLLKPITIKRFLAAVNKVEASFTKPDSVTDKIVKDERDYFFLKSGRELHKLLLDDIFYFESEKEYVRVVTSEVQLLTYRRLKEVEAQLELPFVRIHNSYIINIRRLDKVQDNHVHIAGKQIPISDKFREAFMALMGKYSL